MDMHHELNKFGLRALKGGKFAHRTNYNHSIVIFNIYKFIKNFPIMYLTDFFLRTINFRDK